MNPVAAMPSWDPTREETYKFIDKLMAEMLGFPGRLFSYWGRRG